MPSARKPPPVPREFALLHDFANSLDLRHFVQAGAPHVASDELATVEGLERWMRSHGLLEKGAKLSHSDHRKALELRDALRGFIRLAPSDRCGSADAALLSESAAGFPLVVGISERGVPELRPQHRGALSGLGRILADLQRGAENGNLDRLKMCAAGECRWVFFDQSKPATRRWCSSALCGNRQKTRAYRTRHRQSDTSASRA